MRFILIKLDGLFWTEKITENVDHDWNNVVLADELFFEHEMLLSKNDPAPSTSFINFINIIFH